jgi:hypothetical protein
MGEFASASNGIVGTSAPLRLVDDASDEKLVDGAHSRSDRKRFAILSDPQHRLLGRLVDHPLSRAASFFGSLVPKFGVIEIWCSGHGTRPFSDHTP